MAEPPGVRPCSSQIAPTGAPYKTRAGYMFPYGDYLSLSVDGEGTNHVIWGEGASYNGPGGVWYTRGTGTSD